jgi:hypothetical protein
MLLTTRTILPAIVATLALLASCASAPPSTVIRTLYNPDPDMAGFRNVVVVSVTGTYRSREQFERTLVAALSSEKVSATAYFTVIGRNPQLTRANLHNAIRNRGFDAVIFTRLKGQEQKELAPLRPIGPGLDLFAYDYDELNRDVGMQEAQAITFVTEIYSTASQNKVWAIESLSIDKASAAEVVSDQAAMIGAQIKKDKLLAR